MVFVVSPELATKIIFVISTERKSAFILAFRASMLLPLMVSEVGFNLKALVTIFTLVKNVRMLVVDMFL